jgi:hypothetical protein
MLEKSLILTQSIPYSLQESSPKMTHLNDNLQQLLMSNTSLLGMIDSWWIVARQNIPIV